MLTITYKKLDMNEEVYVIIKNRMQLGLTHGETPEQWKIVSYIIRMQ